MELRNAVTDDLIDLSGSLPVEGLIPKYAATALRNRSIEESDRAAQLVDLIQRKVQLEPQNYQKFIDALGKGDKKYYSDILRILGTAFY